MSISLNNHESRIKVLENKTSSAGSVKQTTLYSGSSNQTITLKEDSNNFDALAVYTEMDTNIGLYGFVPKLMYGKRLCGAYAGGIGMASIVVSGNKISFNHNWGSSTYFKIVIGLKWGGGINFGTLLKRFLVYIKTYSKPFHFHLSEVK